MEGCHCTRASYLVSRRGLLIGTAITGSMPGGSLASGVFAIALWLASRVAKGCKVDFRHIQIVQQLARRGLRRLLQCSGWPLRQDAPQFCIMCD